MSHSGAEVPSGVFGRLALDGHRILREHRSGVEQRAVVLTAVQAMTDADSIGLPAVTMRTSPHRQPPLNEFTLCLLRQCRERRARGRGRTVVARPPESVVASGPPH